MVTTIIPTYNRAELLMTRSLPSALAQGDVEVIVVGDGTDDETVAAMESLADPRVRFWNLPRPTYPDDPRQRWRIAGLEAINFGLDQATHEWVSILPDDDEYLPNHHADLLAGSRRVDVVYGVTLIMPRGQITGDRWPPDPYNIVQGSYLIRRDKTPRIRPEHCTGGAWDGYWWRTIIADGARFARRTTLVHRFWENEANLRYHDDYWQQ